MDESFKQKTFYFPSWPEEVKEFKDTKIPKIDKNIFSKDKYNLLFTGNIGDAQNFGLILELIKISRNEINWIIAGKGRRFGVLEKSKRENNLENLKLLGLLKFEELQEYVELSDALLITLKPGDAFDATIPGKFQTYLSYKKRLIGLIGGEVFDIINKYKIGFASKSKNIKEIKNQILNYLSKEIDKNKFERNIQILNKIYSKKRNINRLLNIFSLTKVKTIIRYLTSSKEIPFDKNFILSAFNLAFCGAFQKKQINVQKDLYVWPDGYYFNKISGLKENKLPGRQLLSSLILPENITEIVVLGNLSENGKIYLEKNLKKNIVHINLPYGDVDDFKKNIPIFNTQQLCILTIPTPKQEKLAEYIKSSQKHFKILCLGAAINMASGDERPLPSYLEKIFIAETVWRLQFETFRRINRLFSSFISYTKGKKNNLYKDLVFKKINE